MVSGLVREHRGINTIAEQSLQSVASPRNPVLIRAREVVELFRFGWCDVGRVAQLGLCSLELGKRSSTNQRASLTTCLLKLLTKYINSTSSPQAPRKIVHTTTLYAGVSSRQR